MKLIRTLIVVAALVAAPASPAFADWDWGGGSGTGDYGWSDSGGYCYFGWC